MSLLWIETACSTFVITYNKTANIHIYDYVNLCTYGLFNHIYHLSAASTINRNLLTL